jgi:hypothetical protein
VAGAPRVLLVLEPVSVSRVIATFDSARLLRAVPIPVGGAHIRAIDLYDGRNYRGPSSATVMPSASPASVL